MLELEHIKKAYDGVTILNDINLQINYICLFDYLFISS